MFMFCCLSFWTAAQLVVRFHFHIIPLQAPPPHPPPVALSLWAEEEELEREESAQPPHPLAGLITPWYWLGVAVTTITLESPLPPPPQPPLLIFAVMALVVLTLISLLHSTCTEDSQVVGSTTRLPWWPEVEWRWPVKVSCSSSSSRGRTCKKRGHLTRTRPWDHLCIVTTRVWIIFKLRIRPHLTKITHL